MAIKKGSYTGYTDALGEDINAGHIVADRTTNEEFYINTYLQAVPRGEGVAVKLKDLLRDREVIVIRTADDCGPVFRPETQKRVPDEANQPEPQPQPAEPEATTGNPLAEVEAQAMVNELRRRGWKVTCKKIIEEVL